ncbi:hypothetical protein IHE45_13G026300 [Dioscorea alata]|uniref:Uncharacterized protein n=1 Tax=Dioscorea alata TaxID=55571 RepID=A0ACB7UX85_DIOAL|nr:hypothetical protein IHE45_13G026300 [Dioscorea alata]
MGGDGGGGSSSSGEEDGDASWRAAIDSVAALDFGSSASKPPAKSQKNSTDSVPDDSLEEQNQSRGSGLKLYQIKKLLDEVLEKSLEIVRSTIPASSENPESNGGIRLFRQAPPGVILDAFDAHQQQQKRPRIIPGEEVNEKSKKFKCRLQSVVVDGTNIMAAARDACQRSLERFEAREAAAKEALKREEERIAKLKKIRGERWLPSLAREMQGGT